MGNAIKRSTSRRGIIGDLLSITRTWPPSTTPAAARAGPSADPQCVEWVIIESIRGQRSNTA